MKFTLELALHNLKVHNALADEEDTIILNYIKDLQKQLNIKRCIK